MSSVELISLTEVNPRQLRSQVQAAVYIWHTSADDPIVDALGGSVHQYIVLVLNGVYCA